MRSGKGPWEWEAHKKSELEPKTKRFFFNKEKEFYFGRCLAPKKRIPNDWVRGSGNGIFSEIICTKWIERTHTQACGIFHFSRSNVSEICSHDIFFFFRSFVLHCFSRIPDRSKRQPFIQPNTSVRVRCPPAGERERTKWSSSQIKPKSEPSNQRIHHTWRTTKIFDNNIEWQNNAQHRMCTDWQTSSETYNNGNNKTRHTKWMILLLYRFALCTLVRWMRSSPFKCSFCALSPFPLLLSTRTHKRACDCRRAPTSMVRFPQMHFST